MSNKLHSKTDICLRMELIFLKTTKFATLIKENVNEQLGLKPYSDYMYKQEGNYPYHPYFDS